MNKQSHAWVKLNDITIDPTESQFRGIKPDDYNQKIEWHKDYRFGI